MERKEQGGKIGDLLVTPAEAAMRFEAVTGVALDDVWRMASEEKPPAGWGPWLSLAHSMEPGKVTSNGDAVAPADRIPHELASALADYLWSTFGGFELVPEYPEVEPEEGVAAATLAREVAVRLRELADPSTTGSALLQKLIDRPWDFFERAGQMSVALQTTADLIDPPGKWHPANRPTESFGRFCAKTAKILWPPDQRRGQLDSKPSVERVALIVAAIRVRDPDTDDRDGRVLNLDKLQRAIKQALYRWETRSTDQDHPPDEMEKTDKPA